VYVFKFKSVVVIVDSMLLLPVMADKRWSFRVPWGIWVYNSLWSEIQNQLLL